MINALLNSPYPVSIYLSIPLAIYLSNLGFDAFQSKLQILWPGIQYLFIVLFFWREIYMWWNAHILRVPLDEFWQLHASEQLKPNTDAEHYHFICCKVNACSGLKIFPSDIIKRATMKRRLLSGPRLPSSQCPLYSFKHFLSMWLQI